MPIFTRLLSTNDIGEFSNMTSWIGILCIVATFELFSTIGVARYDFKGELDDYMASNLLLGTTITLIFYLICLTFKEAFLSFFSFTELELHVTFMYLLVYPALQMFQSRKQIQYEYKMSVLLSLLSVLSATGLSLICVLTFSNKLLGRILGYYVPLIVINLCIYIYILLKAKRISARYWKYALRIAAPLIVHLLAGNLLNSSDRVMINSMRGSSEAAMYTVAYSCGIIVQVLWQSMNTAWSPWAYEMMSKKNYTAMRKASKPYILFFGFVSLGFMLIGPEVLLIMGGEAYLEATGVILPVLAAYVFQFTYSLYVNIEFYYKKQHYIAIGTIVAAVVNIVLNYIFIPKFGYVAAAYTTLIGYIVLFLIHYGFTHLMGLNQIYDTKFIMGFLLAFLAIMFAGIELYKHNIIRYVLIAILFLAVVIAMVVFRKEVIYAIKKKSFDKFHERFRR